MSNKTNSEILDQLLFGITLMMNLQEFDERWLNNEILDVQTGAFLSAFRAKVATGRIIFYGRRAS